MNLLFSYGSDVLSLPAAVLSHIDKATKRDLRVLLYLAAEQRYARETAVLVPAVAKALQIAEAEVENAISFWRGAGILSLVEGDEIASVAVATQQAMTAKPDAPKERSEMNRQPGVVTLAAFSSWIALNAIIGMLYYMGIFDKGILLLIALAYSVCDVICILFFCPFQTWIMKNKCCGSCRIYNWDYAMMFTPFIFIPHPFTWSLLGIALIILFKWEITYRTHPERFVESCNDSISCKNCTEKLCQHKRQLRRFLKKRALKFNLKENPLFKKKKDKKNNESDNA